jgi:hypothetical protein
MFTHRLFLGFLSVDDALVERGFARADTTLPLGLGFDTALGFGREFARGLAATLALIAGDAALERSLSK